MNGKFKGRQVSTDKHKQKKILMTLWKPSEFSAAFNFQNRYFRKTAYLFVSCDFSDFSRSLFSFNTYMNPDFFLYITFSAFFFMKATLSSMPW